MINQPVSRYEHRNSANQTPIHYRHLSLRSANRPIRLWFDNRFWIEIDISLRDVSMLNKNQLDKNWPKIRQPTFPLVCILHHEYNQKLPNSIIVSAVLVFVRPTSFKKRFKSRPCHVWRMFHRSPRFIIFRCRSLGLFSPLWCFTATFVHKHQNILAKKRSLVNNC